jgi:pectate lyase
MIDMKRKILLIVALGLISIALTNLAACSQVETPIAPTTPVNILPTQPVETSTPMPVVTAPPQARAFPGAEGFGSMTIAGRGGRVIEVTNLNDSGPGSLRAAIDATEPRIVVFRVAGMIELKTTLLVDSPYITIAGQTAPGGGVTLRPIEAVVDPLLEIDTHDVVVRYLTFRAGPPAPGDAVDISTVNHDTYNVVLDHSSMSWGIDQVFATWYDVHDISIQWNIFSEALNCSLHEKGCHSMGPMLGSYASDENKNKLGAKDISFHHNLIAHNGERNPLVKTAGVCDVVNNVVYNPFGTFSHVDMQNQLVTIPVNYVGNFFKPGPNTTPGKYGIRGSNIEALGAQIYVKGNIGPNRTSDIQPEIDIVDPEARQYVVPDPHPAAPVTTTSAFDAYDNVLADAGNSSAVSCNGKFFTRRDPIDLRILKDVRNGTGKIINNPSEVGGWITPESGIACVDTDHDGMPDVFEQQYGFNPNDPTDGPSDKDGDGYTNIEEFLNGTDPTK